MTEEIDMRLWHYFLALEQDVAASAAFVEPHPDNHATFSDRYAGMLLLIGSEVDVAAKEIARRIRPNGQTRTIAQSRSVVSARYPNLHGLEVVIPRYGLTFTPWKDWGGTSPSSPAWWDAYNLVKHDRLMNREMASQPNVLSALCGLFLLNLYFYEKPDRLWPQPELIRSDYLPPLLTDAADRMLPDV